MREAVSAASADPSLNGVFAGLVVSQAVFPEFLAAAFGAFRGLGDWSFRIQLPVV